MPLPEYKLYAIRYATRDARRQDHFIGGDPHDASMPMDYFTWVAIGEERVFVIDSDSRRRWRASAGAPFCAVRWTVCACSASIPTP